MPQYLIVEQISERLSETPEGFLLAEAVPVARAGDLQYLPGELKGEDGKPLIEDLNGAPIIVSRTMDDLSDPATLASIEGKDITIGHPDDFVTAENWSALSVGHGQNVRPGDGEDADKILADLLFKDPEAIAMIRRGVREISLGYVADYEQVKPGFAVQKNIVVNHIALVERGRNGSDVAVRDAAPITQHPATHEDDMSKIKLALKKAFTKALDEALPDEQTKDEDVTVEETTDEDVVKTSDDAIEDLMLRLDALEQAVAKLLQMEEAEAEAEGLDEDPTEDEDGTTDEDMEDMATGGTYDAETVSRAEILAPGIVKSGKHLHKRALNAFRLTRDGQTVLPGLKGMSAKAQFIAAAEIMKARRSGPQHPAKSGQARDTAPAMMTSDRLNELNRKHWGAK